MLKEMGVSHEDAHEYIDDLEKALPMYGIADSKLRLAHFFSQVLHESGSMKYDMENLNYSAKRLRAVFPKYFKTMNEAKAYGGQPEKIANRVYARRMGNGTEASGDGWKFRGRGLIQLTGKNNYKAFAAWMGMPGIMDDPDTVATNYAVHSAVFYWDKHKLNRIADADDVVRLTNRVGYDGGAFFSPDGTKIVWRAHYPETEQEIALTESPGRQAKLNPVPRVVSERCAMKT